MGREIRRVPPNWEHPRFTEDDATDRRKIGQFRPCFDEDYDTAAQKWIAEFRAWEPTSYCKYFWEYASPPDEERCRPVFTEEPTWYQLYETVSEGTPVTPPFETEDELIDYLCTQGDFWCQKRASGPSFLPDPIPTRAQAEAMVRGGWAPSAVFAGGRVLNSYEASEEMSDD